MGKRIVGREKEKRKRRLCLVSVVKVGNLLHIVHNDPLCQSYIERHPVIVQSCTGVGWVCVCVCCHNCVTACGWLLHVDEPRYKLD